MSHGDHDDHNHPHPHSHGHGPAHEHRATSPTSVASFVVTCSDTRDAKTDEGGALAKRLLESAGHPVTGALVIPDEAAAIRAALEQALAAGARAVIFTGGTGLARRDVTLDTLEPLFERALPGFGELFRMLSWEQVGSAAMLSRAGAGVVKGAAVFALPGSPRGVSLALERLILPELGHLVRELSR